MFSTEQLPQAVFLLDSGYDAKEIQRGIREIGAHFVSALKSNRSIQGKQVREYFWSNRRWLPWKSIRLHVGNGGKHSRRKYSIRTATGVNLKGVGPITVVFSKAQSRARRPIKYLAASDPRMTGRQIVDWYSRRWSIELWHKEIKQNYGFGDCHSSRFSAVAGARQLLSDGVLAAEGYRKGADGAGKIHTSRRAQEGSSGNSPDSARCTPENPRGSGHPGRRLLSSGALRGDARFSARAAQGASNERLHQKLIG